MIRIMAETCQSFLDTRQANHLKANPDVVWVNQGVAICAKQRGLQPGGSLRIAVITTHLKIAAILRAILVNHTHHGVSVEGRTPAIILSRHASPAPLIYHNKMVRYSGIGNKHDFQAATAGLAARTVHVGIWRESNIDCHKPQGLSPIILYPGVSSLPELSVG
jgi:hypothetical protein